MCILLCTFGISKTFAVLEREEKWVQKNDVDRRLTDTRLSSPCQLYCIIAHFLSVRAFCSDHSAAVGVACILEIRYYSTGVEHRFWRQCWNDRRADFIFRIYVCRFRCSVMTWLIAKGRVGSDCLFLMLTTVCIAYVRQVISYLNLTPDQSHFLPQSLPTKGAWL